MSQADPGVQADGLLNVLGGIDSGRFPHLLSQNQVSWAVNCSFRGGLPAQRPGFNLETLVFQDTEEKDWFEQKVFQGSGVYNEEII